MRGELSTFHAQFIPPHYYVAASELLDAIGLELPGATLADVLEINGGVEAITSTGCVRLFQSFDNPREIIPTRVLAFEK